jgi:formate-dependent nitrite reductase cytochrome c552 subunit
MFLKTTVTTILTFLNTLVTNGRKSAIVRTIGCCDFNQTPEIQIVVTTPNLLFPTNLKCHENLSTGSRFVTCGRTDGRTDGQMERHCEGNRCFSQIC